MIATLQFCCVFAIAMGVIQAVLGRDEKWRRCHGFWGYMENAGRSIALVSLPAFVVLVILFKVFGMVEGD